MKVFVKDARKFMELIVRNGHTKTSFSKTLGVERSYIYKIINGQSLSPILADKICKMLDTEFDEVFYIHVLTKVI